jgi:hypothetical protein
MPIADDFAATECAIFESLTKMAHLRLFFFFSLCLCASVVVLHHLLYKIDFERDLMYRSYRCSILILLTYPHASRLAGGVTRGWNFAIAPDGAKNH